MTTVPPYSASRPVDRLLRHLEGVRRSGNGWTATCTGGCGYRLSVSEGSNGRALISDIQGGCDTEAILEKLGLTWRDLFCERTGRAEWHRARASRTRRITVQELAIAKKLPAMFLRYLGLRDVDDGVAIPYRDRDGRVRFERKRTAIVAKHGSFQPKGVPLAPYGRERLADARELSFLVLVAERLTR
jgi:hypothetical protein